MGTSENLLLKFHSSIYFLENICDISMLFKKSMTDAVTFLFFVAIWMRKKNHEILAALHYKPQGKMG